MSIYHVAIAGGGAVGASTARAILEHHQDWAQTSPNVTPPKIHIKIYDPAETIGPGIPYREVSEDPLLNNIATNNQPNNRMDSDPKHIGALAKRLNPKDPESISDHFASRVQTGHHEATSTYEASLEALKAQLGQIEHERAIVQDVHFYEDGFQVVTDEPQDIRKGYVIASTGHERSKSMSNIEGIPGFFNQYEHLEDVMERLQRCDEHDAIAIRGTSQTMVDWLRLINHSGYQGKIYAISRRGIMPWHFDPAEHPIENDNAAYDFIHLNVEGIIGSSTLSQGDMEELLQEEVHHARNNGIGPGIIYGRTINSLLHHKDQIEKNPQALGFFNTLSALYSNPTPKPSFDLIQSLQDQERLILPKASLTAEMVTQTGNGLRLNNFASQGDLDVSALFDAAIYERAALRSDGSVINPLLAKLHAKDYLKIHPNNVDVFHAGVQNISNLFLARGPATSRWRWGLEGFREDNRSIAETIVNNIWNSHLTHN